MSDDGDLRLDRFKHTLDIMHKTKDGLQRVEVISGVGRRRRWSHAAKARIVAESYEEGAVVSEVARRHGLSPQQLFGWRRQMRGVIEAVRSEASAVTFAPVLVDDDIPASDGQASDAPASTIEIVCGAFVVRVSSGCDPAMLVRVLRIAREAAT